MANPNLQFASLDLSTATLYSTASNVTNFIRVTGDFINGQNTVTNITDVPTFYGKSTIEIGMSVRSPGEITNIATITDFNSLTNTITLDQPAIASATGQTLLISPGTGMYYIKNATFSKTGGSASNPPADFRGITGSLDANYNSNTIPWGVVGQLAITSSAASALTGLYGQYSLTKIPVRTSNTVVDILLTASNAIEAFTQPNGYVLTTAQTRLYVAQVSGSFMPLAASADLGITQGLGLAPYNMVAASTIGKFASGSTGAFPFTGSADITGSLQVTGSVIIEQPVGNVDAFLIKSGSGATGKPLFKLDSKGVAQFFAHANDYVPTAILGGLYYTSQSVYVGVE
jgi:hypothetical protein